MELSKDNLNLLKVFVQHCCDELGLVGEVNIMLETKPQEEPTAGHFNPNDRTVHVTVKNRAIADCFRTIAHELTHMKQMQDGVDFPTDDEGLQPLEDESNQTSGRLVRFFGRKYREIYSDLK